MIAHTEKRIGQDRRQRHIVILALRRSGTTALWRLFRQNAAYSCFDEPFSRLLVKLPRENVKGVRREFIELFNRDPAQFRGIYAPILRGEETAPGMTDSQAAYLRFLLCGGPTVIDVTRCHPKIAELHREMPGAVFVHQYRRPAAFASSHLLPSERADFLGVRSFWDRRVFFTRTRGFNRWGMEELLRKPHAETTRRLLGAEGVKLPPDGSPAVALLLAHWLGCHRLAEREGPRLFGSRFVSLGFEEFCGNPKKFLNDIYRLAEAEPFETDFSDIRNPGSPFQPEDPRWRSLAAEVGFSREEIEKFF
jgi:hypothetical protein